MGSRPSGKGLALHKRKKDAKVCLQMVGGGGVEDWRRECSDRRHFYSCSPLLVPLAHSAPAKPASWLFLQHFCTLTPASGPLHVLYSWHRMPLFLSAGLTPCYRSSVCSHIPSWMGLPWLSCHPCLFIMLSFFLNTYYSLTYYIIMGLNAYFRSHSFSM